MPIKPGTNRTKPGIWQLVSIDGASECLSHGRFKIIDSDYGTINPYHFAPCIRQFQSGLNALGNNGRLRVKWINPPPWSHTKITLLILLDHRLTGIQKHRKMGTQEAQERNNMQSHVETYRKVEETEWANQYCKYGQVKPIKLASRQHNASKVYWAGELCKGIRHRNRVYGQVTVEINDHHQVEKNLQLSIQKQGCHPSKFDASMRDCKIFPLLAVASTQKIHQSKNIFVKTYCVVLDTGQYYSWYTITSSASVLPTAKR